ncbi:peptidoglycan-binding protein [Streptomyces sp. GMY02]|uniref:peptidoglycan-binding domain-containing protein n=1 Tax=Streptomyces sp. GMY02 TaxID=1333528 RepID=UPI001C2BF41F|nr:peptidoglycan-binding domain-containing protein [Streptomyces sp. GMY02]QXE35780.1 peptidoglycan-binding protein [Streptomyces sp. GMY02]
MPLTLTRPRRVLRGTVPVALAVVTALGLNVAMTTSASANINDGYISGSGAFADDWDDEGTLARGYPGTYSNATCLWQKVLYADGYLLNSEVDGVFGTTTEAATSNWQRARGLEPDGIVGKLTFAKAGDKLRDLTGDGKVETYDGSSVDITVVRNSSGRYEFSEGISTHVASYTSRTCA